MAVTLLEAKKTAPDPVTGAVIELYARESEVLRVLPFETITGPARRFNQESMLPATAFRGINQGYTESTGVVNPVTEPLVISGGDLDVDKFLVATQGASVRSSQEAMKVKALAGGWSKTFIKGDAQSDPKEFDGIQSRCTGTQLVEAGSTDGGDALKLTKLDELIDAVDRPTHLIMMKTMRRLLTAASRTPAVSGQINYTQDEFGRRVTTYADLPILVADENSNAFPALAFNEVGSGGSTATATSIYCVSFGTNMCMGIQSSPMMVEDLGELQTAPVFRTRVEWYAGIAIFHPRSIARLRGIKNAAVVA